MAIIGCPNCDELVSDGSPYCPYCGAPVLEMRPPRRQSRKGPRRLSPAYRAALLVGLIAIPLSSWIGSRSVFALGAAAFLVGAGGMVVYRFRSDRFEEDE